MKIKILPLDFEHWNGEYQQAHALGYTYGILKGKWLKGPYLVDASTSGQSFWCIYCKTEEAAIKAANDHFGVQMAEWLVTC